MSLSGIRIAAILMWGLLLTTAAAQEPTATACDRYAATDQSIGGAATGVPLDKIDPRLAIPACLEAVSQYPETIRFLFQLGRSYERADDYAKAVELYRKASDAGSPFAQNNLARLLHRGEGVSKDEVEAVKWFRKAAEQGLPVAQFNLAGMYTRGQGVRKDHQEAAGWYRKAAEQGYTLAQVTLARMYASGRGVPKDDKQAAAWYRKAAEQGHASAQDYLGYIYASGRGVAKDDSQAVSWFRKAAEQGLASAQTNIGLMYESGRGVPQNYQESAEWYRKAAEQGFPAGQTNLGRMYANGRGVPQDYLLAHMWFNLAASSSSTVGEKIPTKYRDSLAKRMLPAQIAVAQVMAQRCKEAKFQSCGLPPEDSTTSDKTSPSVKDDRSSSSDSRIVSSGTGFFINENGQIVTNAHVVDGCRVVRSSSGGELSQIAVDKASDLAIYVASEKPKAAARIRGGRGARVGETVVAIGYPLRGLLSSNPVVTTGSISALSGMRDDRRLIQITAPVQPGNSGGPLLGENGAVIGVVVGKLDALKIAKAIGDIPQNVNFAVSLGTLQSFLNASGVSYELDESNVVKTPTEIAATASRYTVFLECAN
jgi:hypothetical protein